MRNILIVDDHKLIFGGLKNELPDNCELFYASDSASAITMVRNNQFTAAIIDISLGDENGFDIANDLKGIIPEIMFLSMHKTPFYIQKALNGGFRGYFLKDDSLDQDQRDSLGAMKLSLEGINVYAANLSKEARLLAEKETNLKRKLELKE